MIDWFTSPVCVMKTSHRQMFVQVRLNTSTSSDQRLENKPTLESLAIAGFHPTTESTREKNELKTTVKTSLWKGFFSRSVRLWNYDIQRINARGRLEG